MDWKLTGDIAFYACAISAATFVLLYLFFAPWWKTLAGRNIMAVMGSFAAAFIYFAWVISIGGVPPGFYPVRAVLFAGIATSITWRIWILLKHHIIRSLKGDKNELEDAR